MTVHQRLTAFKVTMARWERVTAFVHLRAQDEQGFALPIPPENQAKMEAAACEAREALRLLIG